jgi:hypothetical protein
MFVSLHSVSVDPIAVGLRMRLLVIGDQQRNVRVVRVGFA